MDSRVFLVLLLSLLSLVGCAELAPAKRSLTLQGPGRFEVSLTFPGLHAGDAHQLLQADAQRHAERLGCGAAPPAVELTSAKEETQPPPKDAPPDEPPRSSTTITGVLVCQGAVSHG